VRTPASIGQPPAAFHAPRAYGWTALLLAWLGVIAWCTLRPAPDQVAEVAPLHWYCVVCGDSGVADIVLNILLFLPLGLLLRQRGWSLGRTAIAGLAASTAIEVTQGLFLVGRDAAIGDVLSNGTGGIAGWFLFPGIIALGAPTRRLATRGTVVLQLLLALLWIATAAALRPALSDAPWIGQPAHEERGPVPFPGTIDRETVDGIAVPNETMPVRIPWRDSLTVEIDATRATAEQFDRGIVMLRIVDTTSDVQLAVDQRGDDASLRLRLRGSTWRLHSPRWLVADGMAMTPQLPWRFRWEWLGSRFVVASGPLGNAAATNVIVPMSVGLGWAFIHPFVSIVGPSRLLWTALWLAWWFGLLGWLAAALRPGAALLSGAAALLVFGGMALGAGLAIQGGEIVIAGAAFLVVTLAGRRR
jgi:hypothetical protein